MANPMRLMDISKEEYIELPSSAIKTHLYEVVKKLEEERDAALDSIKAKMPDVDTAVMVIATLVSGSEVMNDFSAIHDLIHRVEKLSKRITKLYLFANNYAGLPDSMIRISLDQAREFGY